ncbi:protein CONSERVED ONLY IN THE GREEN LINEAGE 160, chloroplastic-like [Papaver somniferum]|uniref:protein CONSERVED ONLY IN THE GREEN LINEAGE 160, chloroplastic-like n=1 Tax=Papaver somniferum TaxID=3469 RepID=UPI000E6F8907|nr:protein CONSERVED ONLY IN THE GREEN LINEAGE 160, chloroplastic-like [Papaver somniferum]
MAILNYLSVTSSSTPISPDSIPQPQPAPLDPRQTKVILPKKKPQKWSTGMAPGDYGGPPPATKLRKYWGGEKDPLAKDDFMWNKDFMNQMKRYIQEPDSSSSSSLQSPPVKDKPSGFLSFNRVQSLESMETDLSKELTAPPKRVLEMQVEAARRRVWEMQAAAAASASPKWRPAPTRKEQQKWDRATKAATGGSDVLIRESKQPKVDPRVSAAESQKQYVKLKNQLQLLTLGFGGVGVVTCFVSYSPEIAASFGAGFLGSLIYVRMLGNSVEGLADGARGAIKGAIGQPRLLVPVALVMIFNRWNGILAPEYGLMNLQLIPMLLGFFTYKLATFTQAIEEAIRPLSLSEKTTED